ncbi:MAG TPA: hypothetical protein VKY73_00520 [Polyangiaceae bacterium]|nr:hypothetical protein [Polyangiaceae bacterium]
MVEQVAQVFSKVAQLVSRVPPEAVSLVGELVDAVIRSKDPVEALRRATMAATAKKLIRS